MGGEGLEELGGLRESIKPIILDGFASAVGASNSGIIGDTDVFRKVKVTASNPGNLGVGGDGKANAVDEGSLGMDGPLGGNVDVDDGKDQAVTNTESDQTTPRINFSRPNTSKLFKPALFETRKKATLVSRNSMRPMQGMRG